MMIETRLGQSVQAAVGEVRKQLIALYGGGLVSLTLFGSRARGDAEDGSDIDILVVLRGSVDAAAEIARTGEIISDVSLAYDQVISCVFMAEDRFRSKTGPLLRNVEREGIAL